MLFCTRLTSFFTDLMTFNSGDITPDRSRWLEVRLQDTGHVCLASLHGELCAVHFAGMQNETACRRLGHLELEFGTNFTPGCNFCHEICGFKRKFVGRYVRRDVSSSLSIRTSPNF